ncbi:MAG: TetR/AcrR family transcriptional regulator, partial [Cytophagales bacterium]|nr:TetR/AcrR family transcriptional regulator [Cytophagales bacterium]
MEWNIQVRVNEKLYLKNPELSQLGKNILIYGVNLIDEIGLEDFTFKKLAVKLNTNESSIYRYFESKHRLLLYLFQWYWRWMEYLLVFRTQNLKSVDEKIDIVFEILLLKNVSLSSQPDEMDKLALHRIM